LPIEHDRSATNQRQLAAGRYWRSTIESIWRTGHVIMTGIGDSETGNLLVSDFEGAPQVFEDRRVAASLEQLSVDLHVVGRSGA
jgi:hypothetical protein